MGMAWGGHYISSLSVTAFNLIAKHNNKGRAESPAFFMKM